MSVEAKRRLTVRLLACSIAILLSGCASYKPNEYRTFVAENPPPPELDYHGLGLQSGQLIVSDSGGADSLLLSIMGETYTPFIHAGIVVIEDGKAVVYEGFANVGISFTKPPTDMMKGRIRRITLDHYIRRQRVTAIFDPPSYVDKDKVVAFAQARHRDRTPFDPYFDWRDHTNMYCTEFAALALHAGGAALAEPVPIRDNPSLRKALMWLKITAPEIVTATSLTKDATGVALISRSHSTKQLDSYFAAKRELHTRFTSDQKLGNVWEKTMVGLKLRPQIRAFFRASWEQPDKPATELARSMLGEMPVAEPNHVAQSRK